MSTVGRCRLRRRFDVAIRIADVTADVLVVLAHVDDVTAVVYQPCATTLRTYALGCFMREMDASQMSLLVIYAAT